MADVSNFLSKQAEDRRPLGSTITWRDVFNETDQAIMSISRFMEVSKQKPCVLMVLKLSLSQCSGLSFGSRV